MPDWYTADIITKETIITDQETGGEVKLSQIEASIYVLTKSNKWLIETLQKDVKSGKADYTMLESLNYQIMIEQFSQGRTWLKENCHLAYTVLFEALEEENYSESKDHQEYYENGQLKMEGNYENGKQDGLWNMWFESGKHQCEGNYKNGKQDGLWKFYHENGQLSQELCYKDQEINGYWRKWYENGQLSNEAIIKNNRTISQICYDESGNCLDESGNEISSDYFYNTAVELENSEDYQTALEYYKKSITKDPHHVKSYYNRGRIYDVVLGQYQDAVDEYTKAIQIETNDCDLYYNRGIVYVRLKQYDNGIKDFSEAIKLNPDHLSSYKNRGIAKQNAGINPCDDWKKACSLGDTACCLWYKEDNCSD